MGYNPFSLEGKTILVTGASSGIGRGIAIECSKVGANIILNGRNEERLMDTFSNLSDGNHWIMAGNLTIDNEISKQIEQMKSIDGIVFCAGITQSTPLRNLSKDKTLEVFQTNTLASINTLQMVLKQKKLNKNSSIVFISSVAKDKPYFGNAVYSASKGAVNSFMKVAALELANKSIRVNCIEPGIIITEMVLNSVFTPEEMNENKKNMPLGYGKPEDVAYGCVYLLSDAAKWVTGTILKIDGGQTLL